MGNDPNGARKMFLDHSYACPKILAILEDGLNVITGGTCRKNNKGLPGKYDNLNLPKGCEMGGFKRIYNLHLCLVATQCKYSNTILFISSLSKLEKMEVTQHRGQELITVQCPKYITKYQHNMDEFDRGYQLLEHGAGFSDKAHFKKWYKIGLLDICDFGLLNSNIACNMSCDIVVHRGQELCRTLKKW